MIKFAITQLNSAGADVGPAHSRLVDTFPHYLNKTHKTSQGRNSTLDRKIATAK